MIHLCKYFLFLEKYPYHKSIFEEATSLTVFRFPLLKVDS